MTIVSKQTEVHQKAKWITDDATREALMALADDVNDTFSHYTDGTDTEICELREELTELRDEMKVLRDRVNELEGNRM